MKERKEGGKIVNCIAVRSKGIISHSPCLCLINLTPKTFFFNSAGLLRRRDGHGEGVGTEERHR